MATAAYRRAVEEAQTAARRHGDPAWRLLGIEVDPGLTRTDALAELAPCLDEWATKEGIEDWSQREQLQLYAERFGGANPAGQGGPAAAAAQARRLQSRNARLRVLSQ